MPRIGIPSGMEAPPRPLRTNLIVGYRWDGKHYRVSLSLYQVVAMILAGVTFKFVAEDGRVRAADIRSSSQTLRSLLSHPDMIWWGRTISHEVILNVNSRDLTFNRKAMDALTEDPRARVTTALYNPGEILQEELNEPDKMPIGMHKLLVMDMHLSPRDTFASFESNFTNTTNQNTKNQENTTMSNATYPMQGLSIRSVETKAGWVGQVLYVQNIVWESSPVPNDTVFDNDCITPDTAAQQLAADAVKEFYTEAFKEVTVKGFEAKAKGKK